MISSNVQEVIGKLERAQKSLPGKISEAFDVDKKIAGVDAYSPADGLKKTAQSVMRALANDEKEMAAIPIILNTFSAGGNNPMVFGMRGISIDNISTQAVNDFLRDLAIEDIKEWVSKYKIWTEKDEAKYGKSADPEQAMADHIAAILKEDASARESFFGVDRPGRGALNPTGLAYITGITGLKPDRIDFFLRAILASWVSYMQERMPLAVKAKIREAFD